MAFDWSEYLAVATFLRDGRGAASIGVSKEAALRSAVSRAYYAAFCHARNYARARLSFQPEGDERDHSALRELFQRTNRRSSAVDLNDLRRWRNECDYEDDVANIDLMLQGAIERAERVIARCS